MPRVVCRNHPSLVIHDLGLRLVDGEVAVDVEQARAVRSSRSLKALGVKVVADTKASDEDEDEDE